MSIAKEKVTALAQEIFQETVAIRRHLHQHPVANSSAEISGLIANRRITSNWKSS